MLYLVGMIVTVLVTMSKAKIDDGLVEDKQKAIVVGTIFAAMVWPVFWAIVLVIYVERLRKRVRA